MATFSISVFEAPLRATISEEIVETASECPRVYASLASSAKTRLVMEFNKLDRSK
jgi:hypothetical protein